MNQPPDPPDLLQSTLPPLLIIRPCCYSASITHLAHTLPLVPPQIHLYFPCLLSRSGHSQVRMIFSSSWVRIDAIYASVGRIAPDILFPLQLEAIFPSLGQIELLAKIDVTTQTIGVICVLLHLICLSFLTVLPLCASNAVSVLYAKSP